MHGRAQLCVFLRKKNCKHRLRNVRVATTYRTETEHQYVLYYRGRGFLLPGVYPHFCELLWALQMLTRGLPHTGRR